MGLEPLEFAECLTDSPSFREKLHDHEKELDRTNKAIKSLVNDGKELVNAAKQMGKAWQSFAQKMMDFKFECIGEKLTDDEEKIAGSLKEFGKLILRVEEERDRMLSKVTDFFQQLDKFRKEQIGSVKEEKKAFDRHTAKICQSLERYLNLKSKMNDNTLQEADATLEMEFRSFRECSMKYVLKLQEVQERKKFDFVETILAFMYSLFTFYHQGFDASNELKESSMHLQKILQKTRESFESQKEYTETLMFKMLDNRKPSGVTQTNKGCTKEGYLYLMEKKVMGTTWTKYYCWYKKEGKIFHMMPYNQVTGKLSQPVTEKFTLKSCVRRASQTIDKRFCFDITVDGRPDMLTFQALSDDDRKLWMDAMDGREPVYTTPNTSSEDSSLDDIGFSFIKRCIAAVESRGLQEQGLYRLVGVNSKVNKLMSQGLDPKKRDKIDICDPNQFEIKTITSAVKNYLRSLPEPLMTFKLHKPLIQAAKRESKTLRIHDLHTLIHRLPQANFEMLDILIDHLRKIAEFQDKNLMTVANLGVCFGPTLMRAEEESVAAIMDIKFLNIIVEILINNYERIFKTPPEDADPSEIRCALPSASVTDKFTPGVNHTSLDVSSQSQQPLYINKAPPVPSVPTTYVQKPKLRSVDIYNPDTKSFETHGSSSDSSESLNSSLSNSASAMSSPLPQFDSHKKHPAPAIPGNTQYSNVSGLANKFMNDISGSEVPTFDQSLRRSLWISSKTKMFESGSIKKRGSNDSSYAASMTSSAPSMTSSLSGSLPVVGNSNNVNKTKKRTARTLYQCLADNESELSFEPNVIIQNVRESKEPGWLEGSLNGKRGLIPENYVEFVD
ncbi:rho GTPase-activating protein 26-like isoform X1 [Saccostrea echinata]|uniref:rho GTPase-activating protein 26-like isoform X1 n=1 Tax=Saccostrea echinata TaxID=191078 RepID=UPI002A7F462A|nr:rho GTPase-activating protein 26-like isoform X1 [Saccostrea echinata]